MASATMAKLGEPSGGRARCSAGISAGAGMPAQVPPRSRSANRAGWGSGNQVRPGVEAIRRNAVRIFEVQHGICFRARAGPVSRFGHLADWTRSVEQGGYAAADPGPSGRLGRSSISAEQVFGDRAARSRRNLATKPLRVLGVPGQGGRPREPAGPGGPSLGPLGASSAAPGRGQLDARGFEQRLAGFAARKKKRRSRRLRDLGELARPRRSRCSPSPHIATCSQDRVARPGERAGQAARAS